MCVIDYWAYIPTNEYNVNNPVFCDCNALICSNYIRVNIHFVALAIMFNSVRST